MLKGIKEGRRFIKYIDVKLSEDGKSVLIKKDLIVKVKRIPHNSGTLILFENGKEQIVYDSYQDVIDKIKGAYGGPNNKR